MPVFQKMTKKVSTNSEEQERDAKYKSQNKSPVYCQTTNTYIKTGRHKTEKKTKKKKTEKLLTK